MTNIICYTVCSNIEYRNFHHCHPSTGNPAGYSSGSAGGSVTPKTSEVQVPPTELPAENGTPEALPPPNPTSPEIAEAPPKAEAPAEDRLAKVEQAMMDQLNGRMRDLENKMFDELMNRKREAEQNIDHEVNTKKQRLQNDLEKLVEEKAEQETKLALVSEQLQEKMLCISEEQTVLDELREKSRVMQQKLLEAAAERNTGEHRNDEENDEQKKNKQKEALRLKLAQASQAVTPSPSPAPASLNSTPPPVAAAPPVEIPTSTQRFTSSTHPEAWQYLYRLTKSPDKCDEEIYKAWHEGEHGKNTILEKYAMAHCFYTFSECVKRC